MSRLRPRSSATVAFSNFAFVPRHGFRRLSVLFAFRTKASPVSQSLGVLVLIYTNAP